MIFPCRRGWNRGFGCRGAQRVDFIAEEVTDRTGSRQYNETLGRKRADAVTEYLVAKHDIPIYRIHVIGLGEEKPVIWRFRCELRWIAKDKGKITAAGQDEPNVGLSASIVTVVTTRLKKRF